MPQSPEAFVLPLINDLTSMEQPILLALDDYHVITDGVVQEAMALLLRRTPPNLHLVVLTRADPPFPLPRLRVRERMTEIRDRDLRFAPEEMAAFLNSLHRLNLPPEQIKALESRTEGWIAGLQLAAPERFFEQEDARLRREQRASLRAILDRPLPPANAFADLVYLLDPGRNGMGGGARDPASVSAALGASAAGQCRCPGTDAGCSGQVA
jgi:LuxR family maltose regulon positive regulatory protein